CRGSSLPLLSRSHSRWCVRVQMLSHAPALHHRQRGSSLSITWVLFVKNGLCFGTIHSENFADPDQSKEIDGFCFQSCRSALLAVHHGYDTVCPATRVPQHCNAIQCRSSRCRDILDKEDLLSFNVPDDRGLFAMVFLLGPDDGKGFICGERRSDCERYPSDSNPGHDIKIVPFCNLMCYRREKFRMGDSGLYIDIVPAFCAGCEGKVTKFDGFVPDEEICYCVHGNSPGFLLDPAQEPDNVDSTVKEWCQDQDDNKDRQRDGCKEPRRVKDQNQDKGTGHQVILVGDQPRLPAVFPEAPLDKTLSHIPKECPGCEDNDRGCGLLGEEGPPICTGEPDLQCPGGNACQDPAHEAPVCLPVAKDPAAVSVVFVKINGCTAAAECRDGVRDIGRDHDPECGEQCREQWYYE